MWRLGKKLKCRSLLLVLMLLLSVGMPLMAQDEMAEPDLRIGILPVANSIIVRLLGLFEEMSVAGVTVEVVPLPSAQALREAMTAGELDGFQADLITTLVLMESGLDLRLVRHVGLVSPPFFSILTYEESGIMSVEDLVGARIGISERTVVQYVTDQMLASAGISADEVEYVDIPDIVARAELLNQGEVDAATLPLPHWVLSVQSGARLLVDDTTVEYVPEALSFRADVLAEKGEAVRAVLGAYERGVEEANVLESPEEAIAWAGERARARVQAGFERQDAGTLFDQLAQLAQITEVVMVTARVPTAEEFAHAQDWALGVGLVMEARAYEDVIDGSYLPEMMDDDMDDMSEDDEE